MTVIDALNALLQQQKPDTNTLQQNTPPAQQPSNWVQGLIDAHANSQTGGRIKRAPEGFQFKRDPFDPSSYYDQLGQIKNISTAATAVVNQQQANRLAQQQAADAAARQNEINNAIQGINPQFQYGGKNFSKHYKLKGVASDVSQAADYLGSKFGIHTIYGLGPGSVPGSDHPKGLAIDLMINNIANGHETGNGIANYVLQNYKSMNIKYVIWNRSIWTPNSGWKPYHGPSPHTDHVHLSFYS